MSVLEAVAGRRSIRAFLDKPVPRSLLEQALAAAQFSPSGYNFQPWEAVVLSGAPMRDLSAKMLAAPPQEPAEYQLVPKGIGDRYKARRDETVGHRMDAIGVARDDLAGREAFARNNFRFYGAPAVLLTFIPRVMGPPQWSDVGMWLQSVMLALHGLGLGSCALESLYVHGRLIKDFAGIPDESHVFFCGMAIGWPDPAAPINAFPRTRAPLDEVVRFAGFD
ncbi:MAG: nitroreductase [Sphingomonadales bacterium]|nr:nitroreductase [Sphingomonadales bacterium]